MMPLKQLFRRSNRSLYRAACQNKGDGSTSGPTSHQAKLQAAGDIDLLFLGDYLIEEVRSSNAYSTSYLARHCPSGQVLLVRCYTEEFCLDVEAYRSLTHQVNSIDSAFITLPSDVFELRGRLCVARPFVMGESIESMVNRKKRLQPTQAIQASLILLRSLSSVQSEKIKGLRPSQVILTPDGAAHLVDLDETELLIYRRKTPVRSTNGSPFTNRDRAFYTSEVCQGRAVDRVTAPLYSVGRLLAYMISGDWRGSAQQQALDLSGVDGLKGLVNELCGGSTNSSKSIADAVARLQLYLPETTDGNHRATVEINSVAAFPEGYPSVFVYDTWRLSGLVILMVLLIVGLAVSITPSRREPAETTTDAAVKSINSMEEFKIP